MGIDIRSIAINIIDKNPALANNPRNKALIDAIRSGNNEQGEKIARDICAAQGKSEEQATQEARNFFHM